MATRWPPVPGWPWGNRRRLTRCGPRRGRLKPARRAAPAARTTNSPDEEFGMRQLGAITTLAGVFVLSLARAGSGHFQQSQPSSGYAVLASVTDSINRPLVDLGPDDFVITENGKSR